MSDSDDEFQVGLSSSGKAKKRPKKTSLKTNGRPGKRCRDKSPDSSMFCVHCRQRLENNAGLIFQENAPEGATEEFIALTNPSLMTDVFGSDDEDPRPELRATQVS